MVADIGLVGFPSAGKSSLIAAISRARPKIADYPFTTLVPNLGVVTAGETTFTVADVPGLIEGASEGRGLGHDFLRHVERCAAIVHVIDTATLEPGRNPVEDLDIIENELARYGGLDDRPRLVALNKVDVPDGSEIADMVVDDLRERGLDVFKVSAASGSGLRELTFAMAGIVKAARAARPQVRGRADRASARSRPTATTTSPSPPPTWAGRCAARSPSAGCARPTSPTTRPSGSSPTGSTGSASRSAWSQLGAQEGDAVLIGHPDDAVVFDFKPSIEAGAEILGRRGEDQRFDEARPAARRRREIDEAMDDRAESETRADVARRLDRADRSRAPGRWPTRSAAATTPTGWRTTSDPPGGRRREACRRQGRLLLADHRRRGPRPPAPGRPGRRARRRTRVAAPRSCSSPPARSRPAWPRSASSGVRAASPRSRPPRRWARGCSCTATPRSSPGTASSSARCCSPSTT